MKNCTAVIQVVAWFIVMVGILDGSHSHENGILVLAATPTLTPTPAPAPAPAFANLTDLLELAGPFSIFLSLLEATDLITVLQTQANNTQQGITIFAPTNAAINSLPKKLLANLTAEQEKEVLLAHCIAKFYTLTEFQTFSNPASTMATGSNGGGYYLNITAKNGAVTVSSGYVSAPIASTVHVTDPVALYTVEKVLLPETIFGLPSPSPAPAPSPISASTPAVDSLAPKGPATNSSSPANLGAQQSNYLILVIAAGLVLIL